jgi:hypothetical protein
MMPIATAYTASADSSGANAPTDNSSNRQVADARPNRMFEGQRPDTRFITHASPKWERIRQ